MLANFGGVIEICRPALGPRKVIEPGDSFYFHVHDFHVSIFDCLHVVFVACGRISRCVQALKHRAKFPGGAERQAGGPGAAGSPAPGAPLIELSEERYFLDESRPWLLRLAQQLIAHQEQAASRRQALLDRLREEMRGCLPMLSAAVAVAREVRAGLSAEMACRLKLRGGSLKRLYHDPE